MMLRTFAALALVTVSACSCDEDIASFMKVEGRLETEAGLAFIPVGSHGGASLSGSLYATGTITNSHEKLVAHDVEIEVRLFRKRDDTQHETWFRYFAIDELKKIDPGQAAKFRQYIKQTSSGYERCEIVVLKARGRNN